ITRKKNDRKVKWDREKKDRSRASAQLVPEAPAWMVQGLPGTQLLQRGWTSERGRSARQSLDEMSSTVAKRWTKFISGARTKRDLAIRDQLKEFHLVNRFVEFWR